MDSQTKTDLAVVENKKPKKLDPIIARAEGALSEFLPDHIDHEKFFRVANGVIKSNAYLRKMVVNNQESAEAFLMSLKECAMDGLIPDGKREAAIVPYGKFPTYVRMYGGMLKMMRQSGEVQDIQTGLVCENDPVWEFMRGTESYVRHQEALTDRGEKVACWCVIRTTNGGKYFEVMGRDDILKIKSAVKAKNGPWSNKAHEGEMWRKTVLRRAAKLAPLSTDLHNAFQAEEDRLYDFSRYQRPSAADQMMADVDAMRAEQGDFVDAEILADEAGDDGDAPIKDVSAHHEKLPADPNQMDDDDWQKYADKFIQKFKESKLSAEEFDALHKAELDAMAMHASASFDKILDVFEQHSANAS